MATYKIPEDNLNKLREKMSKIERKAAHYGCAFSFRETGSEMVTDQRTHVTTRYILVEASGTAVVFGWRFAATLEHTPEGNIIRAYDREVEIPDRYYNAPPACEHCRSDRSRKATYIVREEATGEYRQVGRSCLRDYTGGMSAEHVAAYLSFFREIEEARETGSGSRTRYWDVRMAMAYMAECIRHWGYVSSGAGRYGTAMRASDYIDLDYAGAHIGPKAREEMRAERESVGFDPARPESVAAAEAVRQWAISIPEPASNYLHNLRVAACNEWVTYGTFRILCSAFPAYEREVHNRDLRAERDAVRQALNHRLSQSAYVGRVGDRITVDVAEDIRVVTSFDTQYGLLYVYQIIGTDGNVYIWKSGVRLQDGVRKIIGSVKEHAEYRGVYQTVLTRCKIIE